MSTKDGYSVLDKAAKESGPSNMSDAFDLGISIATPPSSFSTMMMMMAHHHRPLPPYAADVVDGGPIKDKHTTLDGDIYHVYGGVGGGGGLKRSIPQHFDISPTGGGGEGMAASLGFPFTYAQWKELERQAMIYKHMVASLPVPPHLLVPPNFRNLPPGPAAAVSLSLLGSGGLSLRLRNGGGDLEPGRCKRTDGKKWRCSRDAAPDQKYCERHLNRGRPRSRKPVEHLPNNHVDPNSSSSTTTSCKKTRLANTTICSESEFPIGKNGTGLQLVETNALPYLQNCAFRGNPCDKFVSFDPENPFGLAYKEPRELSWMEKEDGLPVATTDEDQQWHHLASESAFIYQEEPFNLDLFGQVSSQDNHQGNIFSNETPRGLIDSWSNTGNTTTYLSSNEGQNVDNEMGQIQMGLGLVGSDEPDYSSWMVACTPGGPLAEVLNLSSCISLTNHSSPITDNGDYGISPAVTTVSSPSGVLQKTHVSFSDSSGNSSPTLAGSKANPPEIALWLDQGGGKLASAD